MNLLIFVIVLVQVNSQDLASVFPKAPYLQSEEVILIPSCKNQGIIRINNNKEPPVPRSSSGLQPWPICGHYQGCSCCNTSHINALFKNWKSHDEYDLLSIECRKGFEMIHCKTCDPNQGVQGDMDVCPSFCNGLLISCNDNFFTYDQGTQRIRPCSDSPGTPMCSRLKDLVKDGKDLCQSIGQKYSSSEDCFQGVGDEGLCEQVLALETEAVKLAELQEREAMRAAIKIVLMAIGFMIATLILFPIAGGLSTQQQKPQEVTEEKKQQ